MHTRGAEAPPVFSSTPPQTSTSEAQRVVIDYFQLGLILAAWMRRYEVKSAKSFAE
jgi:hypothetical protein